MWAHKLPYYIPVLLMKSLGPRMVKKLARVHTVSKRQSTFKRRRSGSRVWAFDNYTLNYWFLGLQPENAIVLEISEWKLHEGLCFFTVVSSSPKNSRCLINAVYITWMTDESPTMCKVKCLVARKTKMNQVWINEHIRSWFLDTFNIYFSTE